MLQLQVLNGQDAGKCLSFQQSVIHIGTEIGNDFRVSDAQMSGYHGQIICSREGHYSYSDLQSEHGTRVRAQELDVYLHNTQFPQSVALAGDVEFEIGSTIIACQYRDELEEAIDIRRVSSLSLLTLPRSGDVDMMRFLLETSLELTAKTTHQAVMSYLSKVILQRMGLASHIAVWKLDACSNAFSCIYERSRCNYVQTPLLPDELLRDATQHREAILYRIAGTSLINVIVAPLMTSTRDLGVLIVDSSHVSGLGNTELETLARLSEVAAYAIERTFYNADISALFDGFIRSIISVMDARDPASSGHSQRVSKYALMTAQAIHASASPAFKNVQFTSNLLEELRFAALLHDIGKVVLRREILLKSSKLTPPDLKHLLDRISLFAAWFQTQSPQTLGNRYISQQRFAMYREVVTRLNQIYVHAAPADSAIIREMQAVCLDPCPSIKLLTPQEAEALEIKHGTLTPQERREIERHALISWQYLSQISWPQQWANVPLFVLQHHEKLNGTGYPHGIHGDQIKLQSRILAICDIFDALTGGDRPYKTRHSFADAAAILLKDAAAGGLDPDIVDLFIGQVIPQLSSPDIVSSGSSAVVSEFANA